MAALTAGCRQFPRIKEVRAYVVEGKEGDQGADCHDVADEHWINGNDPSTGRTPIANPMSGYAQYAGARKSWGINAMGGLVVEVEADDGTTGCGVTIGGEAGCIIVEKHLSRFVEGRDPRDVESMWDMMWRATINYGRKGLPIQCISAVDLALWDLLGKLRNEPVCALLGGKTKARLPVYCTTARPDVAKDLGFVGAKIPCPYGPSAGDAGFRKNVAFFAKLGNALKDHGIKWMEEFLPPDDYEGYKEVAMASAYDVLVVPHGSSVYSYHVQYAFANCPVAELINLSPKGDHMVPYFGGLFPDEPMPEGGYIDLPDRPGFGVTLDRAGLRRPHARPAAVVRANYDANVAEAARDVGPPHMPF
ncbi:mandelate racemase/muconate lactonizing enzyme [Aureococcus anophagefferens]|nr:mandelate racemase/muconate lactonizing enzyme [Aureococcus anophagefferens]